MVSRLTSLLILPLIIFVAHLFRVEIFSVFYFDDQQHRHFYSREKHSIIAHHHKATAAATPIALPGLTNLPAPVFLSEQTTTNSNQDKENNNVLWIDASTSRCDVIRRSMLYDPDCGNYGEASPRRLLITGTGRSGTSYLTQLFNLVGLRVSHDHWKKPVRFAEAVDGAISWFHAFGTQKCRRIGSSWRRRQLRQQDNLDGYETDHARNLRLIHRKYSLTNDYGKVHTSYSHFLHVVHMVREPLAVITSRWSLGEWRAHHYSGCDTNIDVSDVYVPTQPHMSRRERAAERKLMQTLRHWVLWNSFVESYAQVRFRTEDWNGLLFQQIYNQTSVDPPSLPPRTTEPFISSVLQESSPEQLDEIIAASKTTTHSNHGHTKHPPEQITWERLNDLDHDFTIMAQLMARRYGYENVPLSSLLPEDEEQQQDIRYQTVCGFDKNDLWDCHLLKQ